MSKVGINILDGVNASNIDDTIIKAKEALNKAKIGLVKKATNPNAKGDTDGDGGLNRGERYKAAEERQKVLNKAIGACKGIKIDFADDVDINNAGITNINSFKKHFEYYFWGYIGMAKSIFEVSKKN